MAKYYVTAHRKVFYGRMAGASDGEREGEEEEKGEK